MLTISSLSTVYVKVPVAATVNGSAYNPTSDTVWLAFTANDAAPTAGEWIVAAWETDGTDYLARVLVGPANSGTVLEPGIYTVWVKVQDNPEVPVLDAGTLTVT